MFVRLRRKRKLSTEELELSKVKKNTLVSLDSSDTKNSIISKSTYQGSNGNQSRKSSLELRHMNESDKKMRNSYSNNNEQYEDYKEKVLLLPISEVEEIRDSNCITVNNNEFTSRIVPVKTIVENNKLTVGAENVKSLNPQFLLREKLKRDFFGEDCQLSLEQMLYIIKLQSEKKMKVESQVKDKTSNADLKTVGEAKESKESNEFTKSVMVNQLIC